MKIDFKNIDWENVIEEAANIFVVGMGILLIVLIVIAVILVISIAPLTLQLIIVGALTFIIVTGSIARFVFGFRL